MIPPKVSGKPFLRLDFIDPQRPQMSWSTGSFDPDGAGRENGLRKIHINTEKLFVYYTSGGSLVIWVHQDLLE